MSLVDGTGLSAADIAAVTGNNNGFGGFGGDGAWWLLVLFLFAFNGNWGGYGNGGGTQFVDNTVQRGFDQSALMTGIAGVQNSITSGVGDVQLGIAGINQNVNQTGNGIISAITASQMAAMQNANALQAQFAQCCCDNRLATCQTQNIIQTDGAATRLAIQNQTQAILDKMCQQEIDAKNAEIANLRTQLNLQNLAASQATQTAQLIADNTAQTQYIVNRVAPYPIPSYTVPNPYGTATAASA